MIRRSSAPCCTGENEPTTHRRARTSGEHDTVRERAKQAENEHYHGELCVLNERESRRGKNRCHLDHDGFGGRSAVSRLIGGRLLSCRLSIRTTLCSRILPRFPRQLQARRRRRSPRSLPSTYHLDQGI